MTKEKENEKENEKDNGNNGKYNFDTNDLYYQAFYTSIRSPSTAQQWANNLHMYMTFHKMQKYSDMIGMLPETLKNPNAPENIKAIQSRLIMYINGKKAEGLRAQTIGNHMTTVRHFYWINDIEGIKWDKVRYYLGEAIRAIDDKAYTHEQIGKILEFADYRLKTVILTQSSTGMRIGAIGGLKWGDLEFIERYGIYSFRVYRGTPADYITFCTPECAYAINEYFAYRKRMGEEITPLSPFMREQFAGPDSNNPQQCKNRCLQSLIRRGFERAGMRQKVTKEKRGKRYDNMLTHGFRKFAKKQMRKAGIDSINIEYLVGHKNGDLKAGISKLMMTYDPSEDNELLQDYLKAVNNLTIDEQFRLKEALTVEQKKRQEEQARNDKMEAQLDEIKRMIRSGAAAGIQPKEDNKE